MARSWHYTYSDDQFDQEADHVEVEYRPGGTVEIIAVSGGIAVDLVGMPYESLMDMVATLGRFHAAEQAGAPIHDYTSTACWHGVHTRCRDECKFGGESCVCDCHGERPAHDDADLRAALRNAVLPVIAGPGWRVPSFEGRDAEALVDAVLEALKSRPAKG